MRHVLLITTMLLALSGCTVYGEYWAQPGGTEARFEAAASNCETAALVRFPPVTMGAPGYFRAANEWCTPTPGGTNCTIIGAGYLPQARSAADTNEGPRQNAFHACMLSGGWRPIYSAAGEAFMAPSTLPETVIGQALTHCRSIFNRQSNTAQFDRCVVAQAGEGKPK